MAGIGGIAGSGRTAEVSRMLDALAHRGKAIREVFEVDGVTLGVTAPARQTSAISRSHGVVRDYAGCGRYAQAHVMQGELVLIRDPLGVAPLYYGQAADGVWCFASEVKALMGVAQSVIEMPPGSFFDGHRTVPHFPLRSGPGIKESVGKQGQALIHWHEFIALKLYATRGLVQTATCTSQGASRQRPWDHYFDQDSSAPTMRSPGA